MQYRVIDSAILITVKPKEKNHKNKQQSTKFRSILNGT